MGNTITFRRADWERFERDHIGIRGYDAGISRREVPREIRPFSWLEDTRNLQVNAYDTDPATLEGEDRAVFVTWNITAIVEELGEALKEFPTWKPWVTRRGSVFNRDRFLQELIDVAHFLANMAVAAGCDDEEWAGRYHAKMQVNQQRQDEGYDGVSGKDETGRATDEPDGFARLNACGVDTCVVHGDHTTHRDANGRQWSYTTMYPATRRYEGQTQTWNTTQKRWECERHSWRSGVDGCTRCGVKMDEGVR